VPHLGSAPVGSWRDDDFVLALRWSGGPQRRSEGWLAGQGRHETEAARNAARPCTTAKSTTRSPGSTAAGCMA